MSESLVVPDANDADATILELDELWSFVRKQDQASVDLDRVVSKDKTSSGLCESGDRSEKTCRTLWEAIPQAYRTGQCYSDFLERLSGSDSAKSNRER